MRIGTKVAAPFAMKDSAGNWSGISIELWRNIASQLHLEYQFEERDLKGLLDGVKDGSLAAGVAAISVTAEREHVLDFTHPIFNSGLGIAVVPKSRTGFGSILSRFASREFLVVLSILFASLIFVGVIMWLIERRKNPQGFGGTWREGIGSGLWWSAVTLTTVGYGDKTPITLFGRLLALLWMFFAIIIVSIFTAMTASNLTVEELESQIKGPGDLVKADVVGTLPNTTAEQYLKSHSITYQTYPDPLSCLNAVAAGKIAAMVYDAPIMKYWVAKHLQGAVTVLPAVFEKQYYAIALPQQSALRKPLNQVLLAELRSDRTQEIIAKYLGER